MGRAYGDGNDGGNKNKSKNNRNRNNRNNNGSGKGGGGFRYHYTVTPTNFVTLPVAKQRRRIGEFLDLLRIIRGPVRIRLARKLLDVPAGGRTVRMPVLQLYLSSAEPLSGALDALRYEYTEDLGGGHPGLRIVREGWRDMVVDPGDGSRLAARCLTLARVPYELPWAWVATGVFPACHEVALWIRPVPHREAVDRVRRKMSLVYEAAQRSRTAAEELAKLERAEQSMRQTHSGMFRCTVVCVVTGKGKRGLRAALREFRGRVGMSGGLFVAQAARQGAMLAEGWGRELTFDLGSMSCLYSMVSADMLEVPNGLVLGLNTDTVAPVIFDFAKRANYNMAIVGTSGSGKSFTAKMVLRRLLDRYPDCLCFVIDPMGEYYDIAPGLGLDRMQVTEGGGGGGGLGLDPFRLLDPADAADILGRVTRAPEDVVKQFRRFSDKVDSIDQLYRALGDDPGSRRWLDDLVDGPLAPMMRGSAGMSDRMVVSLKKADGKPHEAMLLVLALNRVWRRIEEMPQNTPKIVVLDEAWMLFRMEGAAKYVEQIVRMGRKRNVLFLFVSQNVDDIAGDGGAFAAGRIVDNMETKVLMNMEDEAADRTARVLGLSPHEAARIKSFEPGNALVITKKHRMHVRFEPAPGEAELFDTTPAAGDGGGGPGSGDGGMNRVGAHR